MVSGACSLADFHQVLQIVMGWMNSHLYLFQRKQETYGPTSFDDFEEGSWESAEKVCLGDLLQKRGAFSLVTRILPKLRSQRIFHSCCEQDL